MIVIRKAVLFIPQLPPIALWVAWFTMGKIKYLVIIIVIDGTMAMISIIVIAIAITYTD
jgi:hypothetical protein